MKTSILLVCLSSGFLAICLLPHGANSLECIVCNNVVDTVGCGHGKDVDKEKYIRNCNDMPPEAGGVVGAKYDLCRKIITTIEFDVNNNTATERIVRKCGYLHSQYDELCYYRGGFGGRQRVCSCTEDGCNSGYMFDINYVLMAVGFLTTLVLGRSATFSV